MVTRIENKGKLISIIIKNSYSKEGISFFTPDEYSQQLAYMHHPAGKAILPHFHNPVPREVVYTQEILIIKRGKLRADFYDDQQNYLESHILESGDLILLASGGHGFEVLEEIEMIEVKQGPYVGPEEKTRFSGITPDQVKIGKTES